MKNRLSRLIVLGLVVLAGCIAAEDQTSSTEQLGIGSAAPFVLTTAGGYAVGQDITVSWGSLTSNVNDWVALAPAGSPNTTVISWVYTGGALSGSHTFSGLAAGDYVSRAFSDDSYNLLAEGFVFSVSPGSGATVSAEFPTYTVGQSVTVSWSGLPGNATDWVAIAPQGSSYTTVSAYIYTGGQASGSHTFAGLAAAGTYEVRAFPNDSYDLAGSGTFDVGTGAGSSTVSTDLSAYGFAQDITVTWSSLPGTATDWIAIAPVGSPATTVTRWAYTGGAASGSVVLEGPGTGGSFVARAFPTDSYNLAGESTPFTIGVTIATDASGYGIDQPITVSWDNLPTNANDWIAIAPAGSSNTTVITWVYTGGQSTGNHVFAGLSTPGSYVARAFLNDTYGLISETAPFTVGAGGGVSIDTDLSAYAPGQDIVVTWSGLPTNALDWIALAPAGSGDTTVTLWVYTGGLSAGSHTFVGGLSAPGSYVARAFQNDTYTKLSESSPAFDVN